MKIIVIEDDVYLAKVINRTCLSAGHSSIEIFDKPEFYNNDFLQSWKPELAILDFYLGNETAVEVYDKLIGLLPEIKIIMLTAIVDDVIMRKMGDRSIYLWIEKSPSCFPILETVLEGL